MFSKTVVEASFPSNLERTVASALLLLSSSPSKGRSDGSSSPESIESSGFSVSKSSGGSPIAEVTVDDELSCAKQLTVVAFVPEFHELKLKIVRKKRSKSICISSSKKLKTSKPEHTTSVLSSSSSDSVSEITTTEASSCFSSSSSAQSYSSGTNAADKLSKAVIHGHMRHRATDILKLLANGSASEVRIRHLLGDSPSTSKALRMLLKLQEVKRFGAGGRTDPYIYTKAS